MSHTDQNELTEFESLVEHHYIVKDGVRTHFAATGSGKLLVFLHGFPDHWLGWWQIMARLQQDYRVVAIDLRGYNLSDKPSDAKAYEVARLVEDVRAVIEHQGYKRAVIVGHDWGGFVAWHAAMDAPEIVEGLVVLNMPHPWAIARELANNSAQRKASEYVSLFRLPGAHTKFPKARLSDWVVDQNYKLRHDRAMDLSSLEAMFNYYKVNWPNEPYENRATKPPLVKAPTLLMHGLNDQYALPAGLNDAWQWIDNKLEILTLPGVGHFIQHERANFVATRLRLWMLQELG